MQMGHTIARVPCRAYATPPWRRARSVPRRSVNERHCRAANQRRRATHARPACGQLGGKTTALRTADCVQMDDVPHASAGAAVGPRQMESSAEIGIMPSDRHRPCDSRRSRYKQASARIIGNIYRRREMPSCCTKQRTCSRGRFFARGVYLRISLIPITRFGPSRSVVSLHVDHPVRSMAIRGDVGPRTRG